MMFGQVEREHYWINNQLKDQRQFWQWRREAFFSSPCFPSLIDSTDCWGTELNLRAQPSWWECRGDWWEWLTRSARWAPCWPQTELVCRYLPATQSRFAQACHSLRQQQCLEKIRTIFFAPCMQAEQLDQSEQWAWWSQSWGRLWRWHDTSALLPLQWTQWKMSIVVALRVRVQSTSVYISLLQLEQGAWGCACYWQFCWQEGCKSLSILCKAGLLHTHIERNTLSK